MKEIKNKEELIGDFHKLIIELDLLSDQASISKTSDREIIAAGLFSRIHNLVQSIKLLLQNGNSIEADHLARCCLETLFYLGGIINSDEILERYLYREVFSAYETGKYVVKNKEYFNLNDEEVKDVEDKVDFHKRLINDNNYVKLLIKDAAIKSGLFPLYHAYKMQCNGIHCSPHFLREKYMQGEDAVEQINIGPNPCDEVDVLQITNIMISAAIKFYRILFNIKSDDIFTKIHNKYIIE